jgi:hypothetical protein
MAASEAQTQAEGEAEVMKLEIICPWCRKPVHRPGICDACWKAKRRQIIRIRALLLLALLVSIAFLVLLVLR